MQKRAKCILNFKIQKKNKNEKKKAHLFGFFAFILSVHFFFAFQTSKFMQKKTKKAEMQKKTKMPKRQKCKEKVCKKRHMRCIFFSNSYRG